MKIPGRIPGFLELEGCKFPFEFDKEKFELRLYYPTEEYANKHIFDSFRNLKFNPKEHKWIDKINIKGRTAEKYLVYFGMLDDSSSYNGYLTYKVDWYYITDDEEECIDEIRLYGEEVG